jgi:3-mercaptopyruvate sulfurtransferase SseA
MYRISKEAPMEGPIISTAWLAEHRNHPRLVVLDASMGNTFSSNEGGKVVIPGAQHFDLKGAFSVLGQNIRIHFLVRRNFRRERVD